MSNQDKGISAAKVAAVAGLTRGDVYALADAAQLGSPAHFFYGEEDGTMYYTAKGLACMVNVLRTYEAGEVAAAALAEFAQGLAPCAAPVAVPEVAPEPITPPAARRWDLEHERQQEEAA
jgi:hypothetical protein